MVRNDIKNSSLLKTKFLIYAFNGRTVKKADVIIKNNFIISLRINETTYSVSRSIEIPMSRLSEYGCLYPSNPLCCL